MISGLNKFNEDLMDSSLILIHTHFHRKRTGVTRSIENVFPFFKNTCDSYIYGYGVAGRKISTLQLLKLIFSKKQIVFHCHRNNEIMCVLLLKSLGGKFKIIATRHAETRPTAITTYLMKKTDMVVALTENMAKELPFPAVTIGHGVNQEIFKNGEPGLFFNISQKYLITCAGRVRESKGQKFLLEVAAPILENYPEWALAIIGKVESQNFRRQLNDIVCKYSVADQVYFIPETRDIVSFYQASHSVIIPSFSEGFSLVCAEAMSCSCNVLASRGVGVHSEMIDEGRNGYLFDVKKKRELKTLLTQMCEGKLTHLGDHAREEILKKWSSEVEAKNLMKLYTGILKQSKF